MTNNELAVGRNGSIELADATAHPDFKKVLAPKDRAYVQRISDQVTELTILEGVLSKEEKKLLRAIAASEAMMELKRVRAQKKLITADRRDKIQRATGVMEAAYEEYMPGRSLGEKVMSMLPAPEDLPKKSGRATASGGKRR
jgi:predicted KAP-like P-loop ATPase